MAPVIINNADTGLAVRTALNNMFAEIYAGPVFGSAALTKTDDTNVTLTLGGSPNSALLAAMSLTLGWSGQLSVARGGTGASDAPTARNNLGLVIGSNVQAWDADLDAIAALTTTIFGRSLLTSADAAALRTAAALGTAATLASDTDTSLSANSNTRVPTQAAVKSYIDNAVVGLLDFKGNLDGSTNPNYPAALTGDSYVVTVAGKIGGASGVDVAVGDFVVASANNAGGTQASVGASWFVLEKNLQGALLAANNLSDVANAATARANLGLVIGTNVQAYDADLAAIAALTSAADRVPYFTGSGTAALATLTTFGRSLIDDADQAAARSTLGLAAVASSGSFADLSDKPGIRSTGQNLITSSKTLGAADKGSHILAATSGITITFPSSGFANGEGVMIVNISGGNITLSAPGGSDFGTTLPNAGSFVAFCDGGGFWRQFLYTTERL